MFSEELGGNVSKKRAEEAKERRKRLLQQKKATKSTTASSPFGTTTPAAAPSTALGGSNGTSNQNDGAAPPSSPSVFGTTSSTATTLVTPLPSSTPFGLAGKQQQQQQSIVSSSSSNTNTNSNSAVEKATLKRQVRAQQAAQQAAAKRIQAKVRQRQCQRRVYASQLQSLQAKLRDIATLLQAIHNSTQQSQGGSHGNTFGIPIATSTSLLRQFLVLDHGQVPGRNKDAANALPSQLSSLLEQLLSCIVLPGLETKQCVLTSWVVNTESMNDKDMGSFRLRRFLKSLLRHYCTTAAAQTATSTQQGALILKCLRALLLGETTSNELQRLCRLYLLDDHVVSTRVTKDPSLSSSSLDLVSILRHHLLFLRDKPIPADAEEKRDASFSSKDKNRAGALTVLVLDAIDLWKHGNKDTEKLRARVVRDILTVPLLSWRISTPAINRLVETTLQSPTPLLICLLQSFTVEYATALNDDDIESVLDNPDLPMSLCGATGSQRLLANSMQLAWLIPACNGTINRTTPHDFAVAAAFFHVVAALVHTVPLGTFLSSRESAIAWISVGDGNQKAIVLSPTILEQCKALIVDSYVRRLFRSAMDTTSLQSDAVLSTKTESDLKHEQQLLETGNSSAASLAAREARVNRNKSFWESSKWARKLTKGVTKLLLPTTTDSTLAGSSWDNSGGTRDEASTHQVLPDTSLQSRQLAEGVAASEAAKGMSNRYYSTNLLMALVRTYSILLARWGGGGRVDIVAGHVNSSARLSSSQVDFKQATPTAEAWVKSLLNVLCFSTAVVRVSWGLLQSDSAMAANLDAIVDSDRMKTSLRTLSIQARFTSTARSKEKGGATFEKSCAALFYLFLCTFSHVLIITDDVEIHDMDRPLPLHQIRRCILVLKKFLHRATCIDAGLATTASNDGNTSLAHLVPPSYFGLALITAACRTMRDLYDRSSRRPICMPTFWILPGLMENEIGRCKKFDDYQTLLSTSPVFRVCPYMVSFKRRLKLFERIITVNRVEIQGENSSNPFHTNPLKPGIPIRIQRDRLLEDGIATMNNLGTNMRQRIAVQYYNEAGARESGIDAGGLFKEFWCDLCAIAFDPNYALFRTTDGNCLYPNPSSVSAHGSDHITLFAFLGRILGKALYEGITIHPKFAHFFLSFLKGDYNFLHMLPDLSTVDSQLYNNLMFLKTYDGDASDLALSFTVTVDDFGGTREVPLMRNGANIDVTDDNKQLYIGLVAKYYVYDRIREQSEAMTRGLFEVVDRSWLRLFNEPELQVLISGSSDGKIDIDDMKAHCQYAGGYSSIDRTVSKFWKVVGSFDEKQQGALLRFVTSCERAPPLGFGSLNPPFTIHRVGIMRDGDKLPTASTCFNVLKLPTYSSEKVLRDRLLYAIESGAGFELT